MWFLIEEMLGRDVGKRCWYAKPISPSSEFYELVTIHTLTKAKVRVRIRVRVRVGLRLGDLHGGVGAGRQKARIDGVEGVDGVVVPHGGAPLHLLFYGTERTHGGIREPVRIADSGGRWGQ